MAEQDFGPRLKVKEDAMTAIAQIRGQFSNAVIAIVNHHPDACCQFGFHAVPVPRAAVPDQGFDKIGTIEDIEVAAEKGLLPSDKAEVVIAFNTESGTLVAYVNT